MGKRAVAPTWLEDQVGCRLLVHTTPEQQTLDGQLVRVDVDGLVLAQASLEGEYQLGGSVWLPWTRVGWAQKPGGE